MLNTTRSHILTVYIIAQVMLTGVFTYCHHAARISVCLLAARRAAAYARYNFPIEKWLCVRS